MASQSSHYSPFDLSPLIYYEKAPHDEDETHQPSSAEDISTRLADDLAYMLSGNGDGKAQSCTSDVRIENGDDDAKIHRAAASHLRGDGSPRIMIGRISQSSTVLDVPGMRFVGIRGDACNYSSLKKSGKSSVFEVFYRLNGDRYPVHKISTNGKKHIELRQSYEIVKYTYDITRGRTTYLLACSQQAYQRYVAPFEENLLPNEQSTHPFSFHLTLLAQTVVACGSRNDRALRRLMMLENIYLRGDSTVTFDTPDETKHQLQVLHGLFLGIVLNANENKRHLSIIEDLMRDLDSIEKLQQSESGAHVIDPYSQQRLVDGFRALKGYCENRGNRLASRQQRVQNLINLIYNLLANRDSKVNLDIASESKTISERSAVIAFEARQDGAAMMTIAVLTMAFLPATFVSSILGSNLFTLEDDAAGKRIFVASGLWWIYLASAIPLTLLTFSAWGLGLWWRSKRLEESRKREVTGRY